MSGSLRIDKKRTALVVIDLQKGIAEDPGLAPYSANDVISNSSKLLDAFRQNKMPVFLVRVELSKDIALQPMSDLPPLDPVDSPPGWADFVPGIIPLHSDIIVTKRQWAAFYGTELDLHMRRRKIGTIVLCGVATDYGVEGTAREAYELGYEQIFAEDAMSSSTEEQHRVSIDTILKRLGRVRSTKEILNAINASR